MADPALAATTTRAVRQRRWRRRNPMLGAGGAMLVLLLSVAAFADVIVPHAPDRVELSRRLRPGGLEAAGRPVNAIGTDFLGRDQLSRLVHASRTTLRTAFLAGLIGAGLGLAMGLISLATRWSDPVLGWLAGVFTVVPLPVLGMMAVVCVGPIPDRVAIVLGVLSWPVFWKRVHGRIRSAPQEAGPAGSQSAAEDPRRPRPARVAGAIWRALLVAAALHAPALLLTEGLLSFLGFGVPNPGTSWGGLIREGQNSLFSAPWLSVWPGVALTLTAIAATVFAWGLREELEGRRP